MTALLLAACAIVATLPAWRDLLYIGWHDEEASQVLIAPFAALWLAWLRRDAMRLTRWQSSWLGPALILLAASLYNLGDQMLWQALWHLSAPLALVGALTCVFGSRWLGVLAPAACALLFMVPVPGRIRQAISLPMQEWTAIGGQRIFELLGAYVERTGNILVIDGSPIEVEEACNGLRLIFALTLVCYVYAFSVPMKPWARVLLLLVSPLLAVALNTLRLVPTAWMFANATPERAQFFHDATGWLMLPLALACLILAGWVITWVRGRRTATAPDDSGSATDTNEPQPNVVAQVHEPPARHWPRSWGPIAAAFPIVFLIPLTDLSSKPDWPSPDVYHAHIAEAAPTLPYRVGGWIGSDSEPPPAVGELLKPNVLMSRTYRHLDTGELASILFVQSRDARDLAGHYPPVCYPAHGWQPTGETLLAWTINSQPVPITRYSFYRDQLEGIPAITVYDLFVLPGVGLTPDMDTLRQQAERRHTRAYGAAHWMVVFPASMSATDQAAAAAKFTDAAMPLLQAVVDVQAAGTPTASSKPDVNRTASDAD